MVAFAVPISDDATGLGWATSGFGRLDEGAPGGGDVATQTSNNPSEFLEKTLSAVADPEVGTGHIIRARWRSPSGNRTLNGRADLYEDLGGGGQILIAQLNAIDIGTTLQIDTLGIGESAANNITDYTNLQIRCFYTYTGGGSPSDFEVDFFELEVPDPPAGVLIPPRRQLTTVRL